MTGLPALGDALLPGRHPSRIGPAVAPVVAADRPLWTVLIPTYNCAPLLRRALESVLRQDPGQAAMQICVVDDHSTKDDPGAVVRELAADRVEFHRQPANVGQSRNFNSGLQRSMGRLIHVLNGDDEVLPNFYSTMGAAFTNDAVGAAFCRQYQIDDDGRIVQLRELLREKSGVLEDALRIIATTPLLYSPAMVVRRDVYETLGGFDDRPTEWIAEDYEMWVRIAAHYAVGYEVEPLVLYRKHSTSFIAHSVATGRNIRGFRRAIDAVAAYLTPEEAASILPAARDLAAFWGLSLASDLLAHGRLGAAFVQAREALRTSHSRAVAAAAIRALRGVPRKALSRGRASTQEPNKAWMKPD